MATRNQPSLYERLGGVYAIATVVDDFIDRIMVDPRLNANPRVDDAHHRVSTGGVQVPRHRNGLLGDRWTAKVHRSHHAGLAPSAHDHGRRVAGFSRRLFSKRWTSSAEEDNHLSNQFVYVKQLRFRSTRVRSYCP